MDAPSPDHRLPQAERSGVGRIVVVAVFALVVLWSARETILDAVAGALVHADPLTAADVIVVSQANGAGDALEAADLYLAGLAPLVVVPRWVPRPYERQIRSLGVIYPTAHELAREVLIRKGVPRPAIIVLEDPVDGLTSETTAVAAFARAKQVESMIFVTVRSHSARAAHLLHAHLGDSTRVVVTSPHQDRFPAPDWWRRRDQAREVVTEYIRWITSLAGPARAGSNG